MIERRPRAPVSRSSARSATARSASWEKTSSIPSKLKKRWNCLTIALRGSVRIVIRSSRESWWTARGHRQAADELRDQPVLHQVLGQAALEQLAHVAVGARLDHRAEADALVADPPLDHLVEVRERPAADEQDVRRVDRQELLVRVLAPALRRHRRGRPLEDLQQRLLDALARHVARDRRVVGLAGDLVDLVDVDDPGLGLLDVVVRGLDQLQEDVLDVLADVAGLRQRGGVGDGERDVEDAARASARAASCRSRSARAAGCSTSAARCPRRRPASSARACSGCRPLPRACAWPAPARRRTH